MSEKFEVQMDRPIIKPNLKPKVAPCQRPVIGRRPGPVQDMTPGQALTLACLLVDFEMENPVGGQPSMGSWLNELRTVRATLMKLKSALEPENSAVF